MKKDKHNTFEDDGRSVADMSGVEPQPMFAFRRPPRDTSAKSSVSEEKDGWTPPEYVPMTRKERRPYLLAALGATLLIAAVFLIAAALLIWLMLLVWR